MIETPNQNLSLGAEQNPKVISARELLARRGWYNLRYRRTHADQALEFEGAKDEIDGTRTALFKYHPGEEGEQGLIEVIDREDSDLLEDSQSEPIPRPTTDPVSEPPPGAGNERIDLAELRQKLAELRQELTALQAAESAAVPTALTERIAAAEAERDAAMAIAGISKPEFIRDIQSASQALKDNPDRERIVRSLGKAAPEYVKTLAATFKEFPGNTEKERTVRRAVEQRRYKLFEEGVRKTSEADVKRIGEAIWNFQQKPWHERWGLSGVMAYAGGGAVAGAIAAAAFFGSLPIAAAAPLLAAPTVGMGVMKWVNNIAEKRNATGCGKGFVAQHPHIAGLLIGGLAAYGAGGVAVQGPGIIANLFEKIAGGSSAALKGLLGLFSVKSATSVSALSSSPLNI